MSYPGHQTIEKPMTQENKQKAPTGVSSIPIVRLFAYQPKCHGRYSFFVAADSEQVAMAAIATYITKHKGKNDGHYVTDYSTDGWGTDYYALTVLNPGQVITNDND
jgi:hypothetical protein